MVTQNIFEKSLPSRKGSRSPDRNAKQRNRMGKISVCINKYSMRQWAYVIDLSFNWISTSATDLYFAKKPCFLLRPYVIPEEIDMDILNGVKTLTTYEDFITELNNYNKDDSIPNNSTIEYYYGKNTSRMAFLKTADICDKMMSGELLGHKFDYGKSRLNMTNEKNFKSIIREYLKILLFFLFDTFEIEKIPFLSEKHLGKLRRYKVDVYGIKKDIIQYRKRFSTIIPIIHSL